MNYVWEQRKFSELVMIERGGSPRPIDKYITKAENGLNWVKIGDAPEQSNYITKTSEKIIPEGLSKTREVHPGDLILSNSMSFGRPYIMAIDGCIHDGWLAIRDTEKRFDLKFLCTLLGTDSMLNQYKAMAAGSTVNNLNKELVGSTIVSFPKMDEQTKIGEYFTNLDHLITLHQRKIYIFIKNLPIDWEQRKLGEIAPLRGGYAFQSNNFLEEGIPIVKISNILSTGEVAGEFSFYEELDNDTNFILPDKAAVLAMSGATTGKVSILSNPSNIKFYQNQRVGYFKKTDGINYPFISTLVRSQVFNNQLNSILVTGAQPNVSSKDIDDFDVLIPTSYKEQKKIGAYFSNLDHLITLHHRKCVVLRKMKVNDWEQRKLGEIYGSIGNAFVGTATPYYVEQGHFYLESNNVKDGQINHNSEIFINDEFYEKQKDKWLHTGDMVMVQSGHVGHAAVIPEELDNTAAHALIMFRNPKEKIEPYFLNYEYQTNKAKKKIENITTGNTIKHILASDMQEFVVDVPKYEEQKVIADYFSNLDHLITLHQHKCDELQNFKKYMLQNMFVYLKRVKK